MDRKFGIATKAIIKNQDNKFLVISEKMFLNNFKKFILIPILFSFFIIFTFVDQTQAVTGVPKILNHQGRLLNPAGELLGGSSGTNYCFRFSIWDAATGGSRNPNQIWPAGFTNPSTMTVFVKNGVFNVGIGAGADTLDFDFQNNNNVYLNVEVANSITNSCDNVVSFEPLDPRQRIVSAGYAINANTVGGFTSSQSPTGNQIPVLTSGNLLFGGAVTIDSTGTAALNFGTGANAKTITIGNTTGATTLVLIKGAAGNITFTGFNSCTALETDLSGNLVCGTDDVGGGGGAWSTSTGLVYMSAGTVVLVGGSATTSGGNAFEVIGNSLFDGVTMTGLTIGAYEGFLKATAGVVGTSTIGISEITGLATNYISTTTGLTYLTINSAATNYVGTSSLVSTLTGYYTTSTINASNTAWLADIAWSGTSTGLVAATGRTSLGLGDSAILASTTWLKVANNLSDGVTSTMRTNLGLVIGTNVQAYDANNATTGTALSVFAGAVTDAQVPNDITITNNATTGTAISVFSGTLAIASTTGILVTSRGGTGTSTADWTGFSYITAGTWGTSTAVTSESDPKWVASSTSYLTVTTASSTYLATGTAALTYLTITNAVSTYLATGTAASTYLTITNAGLTYLATGTAVSTYLATGTAATTYPTFTYVSTNYVSTTTGLTYLTTTTAASTYLTQTSASTNYVGTSSLLSTLTGYYTTSTINASNTAWLADIAWSGTSTGLTAATGRTSLGLGDSAVLVSTTWFKVANNLSDSVTSTVRTNLGLVIGTNVQAYDTNYATTGSAITGFSGTLAIASTSGILINSRGGTGTSTAAWTGFAYITAGTWSTTTITGSGTTTNTASNSGLEVSSSGLAMLRGCANGELLKWNSGTSQWQCGGDVSGGSPSLNTITAALADSAVLDSNTNTLNWNWDFQLAGVDSGLNISESQASILGTQDQQAIVEITTLAGSTASPLQITSNSADVGDIFIDLASSGDFEIRDNSTAFVTFSDTGLTTFASSTVFNATSAMSAITIGGDTITDFVGTGLVMSGTNLTVGAGFGITVNADNIAIATSTNFTWGGTHTFNSGVTIAAAQSYTGAGAVTLSSGGGLGLTLDSASNILTIDSSDATITASGVTTLTLGAGVSITNASGDIILQPAGSGVTADVQIGTGGVGSATPDLFVLDVGSAEPSGTNGAMYYSTTTQKFRCYENNAWKNCDTTGSRYIVKSADEDANTATTTLKNDSELKFTMAANSTYYMQASIDFDMFNATADGSFIFTVPSGATTSWQGDTHTTVTALSRCMATSSTARCDITIATAIRERIYVHGIVINGTNAGDLQFKFGQRATSSVSAPRVKVGSWLMVVNAVNVGGADLAEVFYSVDDSLVPGDVVALDPALENGVQKSTTAYNRNVLGVISTQPGLILGEQGVKEGMFSVYIALAGRVPVKVSTENGPIQPGDMLTSSLTPGVAMKATKAGPIIGFALTSYEGEEIGTAIVFTNTTYSHGVALASLLPGLTAEDENSTTANDIAKQILVELINQKEQLAAGTTLSEILTDRLAAGLEIITPRIVVQGLEVESIGALNDSVTFLSDTVFFGRPYFTTDTAGFAVIKEGGRTVEVVFEKEYIEQPIVNTTISLEEDDNADDELIFANDINYIITKKSVNGFDIMLNKPAPKDIKFSWIALAVKNAKTFTSIENNIESMPELIPEATPQPTPEVIPEPTPELTPETTSESLPEPAIEPVPEIISEPTPEVTPEVIPELTPEPTSETISQETTLNSISR